MPLVPLEGHEGGRASLLIRNKSHSENELLLNIVWAKQDSGYGLFVNVMAQNRAQDFCHPVQEIRIDTIEKRDDLSIVLNIGVAGISFEDSTVFVDIH